MILLLENAALPPMRPKKVITGITTREVLVARSISDEMAIARISLSHSRGRSELHR
jgi:hypothetical protein